ncbi:uncharacterized protein LOC134934755 isoform X3 [Pseudophryne corroboree]|uniref:uncharacterized protein LOC134934755 isoform X3 n=1 Tax=Pseudophryne corroboree TaxID=495146 RepID=UPI003081782F
MKIAVFLILILNLTNAHDGVSYQIPKLKPLDKCTLQAYINTALSILKAEEDYRNCSESERATRGQCVADQSYSLLKIIAFELGCEFKTLLKLLGYTDERVELVVTEDYDQLLENKSVGDIVGDVMRCLEGLSARPQILFKDQLVTTNNHVEGLSAVPQILFKDQLVTTNNHVLLVKNMISHSFIHDTLEDERKILSALLFGSKSQFQEFLSILKNVGNA